MSDRQLSKPSILAVTRDTAFLRAIRLEMPLLNLRRQGLIGNYFITNPSLFDVPDDFLFDVVWLQRPNNARLIEHLAGKIDSRYMVDVDDLLVGSPSYIALELIDKDVTLEAVQRCRTLTVTSGRLGESLQRLTGNPIVGKTVVCPNAFEFSDRTRAPSAPQGILLTSSDHLALTNSKDSVLGAISDFSKRHDLPVHYFGMPNEELSSAFARLLSLGPVSFWHYHALLASMPPMIGVAPLETVADQDTLEFISCKSDIKMIDFGGFGHPSVYSKSPAYVDTDLQAGTIVENSTEAWSEGLEACLRDLWTRLDSDQERIVSLRNMDKIASECWYKAAVQARLPEALRGREIRFRGGSASFFIQAARHMVLSQDHFFRRRIRDRVSPSLLNVAKKFLSEG
jgi:hypothetical protein